MKKGYKECPFCKNEIRKGAIKCQFCKEMLPEEQSEIKECPYCKNEIKYNAVKCQYCNEYLGDNKSEKEIMKIGGEKNISKGTLIELGYQENKVNRWTYKGRLGIRNFYKMFIIFGFCFGIIASVIVILLKLFGVSELIIGITLLSLWTIFLVYFLGFIVNRRLKDRGKNLWHLLFCLIPIVGWIYLIYLIILIRLVPGNEGENEYGKETDDYLFIKKRWSFGKRLLSVIIYLVLCFSLSFIVTYISKDNWQGNNIGFNNSNREREKVPGGNLTDSLPEINPEDVEDMETPILVTEDGEIDEMDQTFEVQLENGEIEIVRQGDLGDAIQID